MRSGEITFLHDQNLFVFIDDEASDADHRVGEFGELGRSVRRKPFQHEDVLGPRVVELEAQRSTNGNEGRVGEADVNRHGAYLEDEKSGEKYREIRSEKE